MECTKILEAEIKKGNIQNSLFKGSPKKELITELQRILFELGFRRELKWDQYQADGDYGRATSAAVKAFAEKNDINSNGEKVTKELAELMLDRHEFLPSMYLLWQIHQSDLRTKKYISRGTRISITAVQELLHELGYDRELNFEKYGADGLYGNSTRKAVIKFAKDHGIESDGDLLTRPLINLMIKKINLFYGRNWMDLATSNLPGLGSPLVYFEGSRFQGKPCRADRQFIPMLKKINKYAKDANVFIFVTSSFRTTTNVAGAIVTPAKRSNHMAGHAIDMNVIYDENKWANSKVLTRYPNVPGPVKKFLRSIITDPHLRWGGKFSHKDPVHIDDHLNKDLSKWKKRYTAMQKAVQLQK